MDTIPYTWDNLATCFDQFMSLSEDEIILTMDGCGDGFKKLVALQFGTPLLPRRRHPLFFVVVTCLVKQMCKIREGR